MKLYKSNRLFTVEGKKKAIEFATELGFTFLYEDRNLLIFEHPALMMYDIKFGYPNGLGIFGNLLYLEGIKKGRREVQLELKNTLNL